MNKAAEGTERLGEFEQLALLAVMRLGEDAYGAQVQEELEAVAGREASISQIYITLMRLESKGMVSSWMGPPEPVRGGKARRHFRVEPAGALALNEARTKLLAMWDGLEGALEAAAGGAVVD
jgi:DNA-binding PadR family transcriptional regulator